MPTVASLQDFNYTSFDTNEILFPNKLNSRFGTVKDRINDLNDVAEWLESNSAGSSAAQPDTVRGRLWADTSNSGRVVLKLDPDGLGADDEVSTRLEGYRIGFANAGTDTCPNNGPIEIGTTQVGAQTGETLLSYTVPANTLSSSMRFVSFLIFGSKSGSSFTASPLIKYNGTLLGGASGFDDHQNWMKKIWLIYEDTTTVKWQIVNYHARDDRFPQASNTNYGTVTATSTEDNTLLVYENGLVIETIYMEGYIVRYGM